MGTMNDLLLAAIFAIGINLVMFVPAFIWKTDKLTDISYALSFIALMVFGLLRTDITPEKILIAACVVAWAIRLGSFLLARIWHIKYDKRFDGMRENFRRFLQFWLLQGVSVFIISLAVLLFLASDNTLTLPWWSYLGIAIFLKGLIIEATADIQKFAFTNDPKNKGKWIDTGLWSKSRHPNYFGEMLVWTGLYVFAAGALSGWELLIGLASPLFIICLLLFVSGVPPLEKGADKRWGDNPKYQAYKKRTPLLIPFVKL